MLGSSGKYYLRCRAGAVRTNAAFPAAAARPERWDNLPELVKEQPGLWQNILTFSSGPRVSGRETLQRKPVTIAETSVIKLVVYRPEVLHHRVSSS